MEWATKKFHTKKVVDPATGKARDFFVFDDTNLEPFHAAAADEEAARRNFVLMSRNLPDPRGGFRGAGAIASVFEEMATIKLSARRLRDREAAAEAHAASKAL